MRTFIVVALFAIGLVGCGPTNDPDPGPSGSCTNTCEWAFDGQRDDGRPGADYDMCAYGPHRYCHQCRSHSQRNRGSCIESGPNSCSGNSQCCSGICLSDTGQCHDSCTSDFECNSNCCVPLQGGGGACASSLYCN